MKSKSSYDHAGRPISHVENARPPAGLPPSLIPWSFWTMGRDFNRMRFSEYAPDGGLSKLTALNADTGNQITRYRYGTSFLNMLFGSGLAASYLLESIVYPNGSIYQFVHNTQGEVKEARDPRGTVHQYERNRLGQLERDKIVTFGPNVDTSVDEISVEYDNSDRPKWIKSRGPSGETNGVNRLYTHFGQPDVEFQTHHIPAGLPYGQDAVRYFYANDQPTSLTQPRNADTNHNHVRRIKVLGPSKGGMTYEYLNPLAAGLGVVDGGFRVTAAPTALPAFACGSWGLGMRFGINRSVDDWKDQIVSSLDGNAPLSRLDAFDRIREIAWESTRAGELQRLNDTFSANSLRTSRTRQAPAESEYFDYDGLDRTSRFSRNLPAAHTQEWLFDITDNWLEFRDDSNGDGTIDLIQGRTHGRSNQIKNITQRPTDPAWVQPLYDNNGNLTRAPRTDDPTKPLALKYDGWNRLTETRNGTVLVARNHYDGLNRRVAKELYRPDGTTIEQVRHYYYSDDWQEVAFRDTQLVPLNDETVEGGENGAEPVGRQATAGRTKPGLGFRPARPGVGRTHDWQAANLLRGHARQVCMACTVSWHAL